MNPAIDVKQSADDANPELPLKQRNHLTICGAITIHALKIVRGLDIVLIILYRVVLAVLGGIFFASLIILMFLPFFVFIPLLGTLSMLTGNAIWRDAHPQFLPDASAALVGVVGSVIAAVCVAVVVLLIWFCFKTIFWHSDCLTFLVGLCLLGIVVHGALSGIIGYALLNHKKVDLGGTTDALHVTYAGALGGIFMMQIMPLALYPLFWMMGALSPVWEFAISGTTWVLDHVIETITPDTHCYSIYGMLSRDQRIVNRKPQDTEGYGEA